MHTATGQLEIKDRTVFVNYHQPQPTLAQATTACKIIWNVIKELPA